MAAPVAASYCADMTKNESEGPAPKSDRDLEKFEKLPADQKELQRLKDEAEKSSGPTKANLDQEIRRRSGEKAG